MKKLGFSLAVLAVVALAVAGFFLWPKERDSVPVSTEQSLPAAFEGNSHTVVPNSNPSPNQIIQNTEVSTAHSGPEVRPLATLMSAPVSLRDGGLRRDFQLSTTEISLRTRDGAQKIVTLPPSNSPQAFAAALEKLRAEHDSEPELVLYPVGSPQNEFSRRIATRQVLITAPSRAEADALAAAHDLVFLKAPSFASNFFVYEAASPLEALALESRNANGPKATPLLASQAAKKTIPNDPYFPLQWHLKYQVQANATSGTDIQVESIWNYPSTNTSNSTRGRGVVIGIVDDGMEWKHPDLRQNVIPGLQWDWNGSDSDPTPFDFDSHGTACAGVAAARGNNRIGVSGVAPEASLAGMRLIAAANTDLDEAEAMTWKMGEIQILSNSWGPADAGNILDAPDTLTLAALKAAADFGRNGKGTILTWAGGNGLQNDDNSNYDGYANSIYTIAIAAMDSDGFQSSYSESGANIIVAAPSDGGPLGILTTDNRGSYGYNPGFTGQDVFGLPDLPGTGDLTKNFGGTSSATPVVSGVIALMLEKNPELGWRDVQEILMRSAAKINPTDPDWKTPVPPLNINHNHKFGAGLVNATAAVSLSGNWTNLVAQTSASAQLPTASPQAIGPGATITRTFSFATPLRSEHVTLAISLPGIKKGDLQIDLTSPAGTNSVFCEPHSDQDNEFEDWTFMTVRNWGESANGFWKLTITNTGTSSGNLTAATLTVFGTPTANPTNPLPVVNLEALRSFPTASGDYDAIPVRVASVGTPITLSATATDKDAANNLGSIAKVEFFSNNGSGPVSIGNVTTSGGNSTYTLMWTPPAVGNFSLTATATDAGSPAVSATSAPVRVGIQSPPFVAWDFDTLDPDPPYEYFPEKKVPLESAIQSHRQYSSNFRVGSSVLAAWEVNGVSGGASLSPVVTAPSATVTQNLTLGSGFTSPATPVSNVWGGMTTGNSSNATAAIAANAVATFQIQPKGSTGNMSLHSIDPHNLLRNTSGPTKILWQYGFNGTFKNIGIARDIGTNLTMAGNQQSAVQLDQIPDLQSFNGTVSLRMVLFGGNGTGNWFINDQAGRDLVLRAPPPRIIFDGTLGSSDWNFSTGEIWFGSGSTVNALPDSNPFSTNTALVLRAGKNLAANGKHIVFQIDMSKARRLEISYATMGDAGGFTTHTWEYWNELKGQAGGWEPILDQNGSSSISVPPSYTTITLDQVPGPSFNGHADARVRLTVSGATSVNGTNLLDNIRFNATVAP